MRIINKAILSIFISFITSNLLLAQSATIDFPIEVCDTTYLCSADSSFQPAMVYFPDNEKNVPLLVGLHPWSSNYTNFNGAIYSIHCIDSGWAFIFPNFRGKNNNPNATGSDIVVQDIIDAVEFCISHSKIDTSRIYLVGASGGGHAALLLAAKKSEIWAGVSAWVPISDLQSWYLESKQMGTKYWKDIYNSCGGDPTTDMTAVEEAINRSPINFLTNELICAIDINAGIHDGHDNYSVPISHSLLAFNRLALSQDTLLKSDIEYFVLNETIPSNLSHEVESDDNYGEKEVLFRRTSNNTRITIFEGNHEIIYNAAFNWLSQQRKIVADVKER